MSVALQTRCRGKSTAAAADDENMAAVKVVIRHDAAGIGVIAAVPLVAGERIFACQGAVLDGPTRYSVCIEGVHIQPEPPSCYLNHSCAPNCHFQGRWFVALENIAAGEPLTFDYVDTEPMIAEPFDCACGAENCRGRIDY